MPRAANTLRGAAGRPPHPGTAARLAGIATSRAPSQRNHGMVRISAESEAGLVTRARQGDSAAFGALVERHAPMVRRLTRAVLQHGADGDDAAQDAFFSAWQALDRFDPAQPFGPWMARIAVNAARDLVRRRKVRSTEPLPLDRPGAGPGPAASAEAAEQRERLRSGLAGLPERQRLVVVLFEVDGYAHAEIAQLLGLPEGTVRSDLFHAKRRLRVALDSLREE